MFPEDLEQQKQRYIQDVSERYAVMIRAVTEQSASVYDMLSGYEQIRLSLEKNQVQQSVAYFYNSVLPGTENCYDFLEREIRRIGRSVQFIPAPLYQGNAGGVITVGVKFYSDRLDRVGPVECLLYYDRDAAPIKARTDVDNTVRFRLNAASIPAFSWQRRVVALDMRGISPALENTRGKLFL